MQWWILWCTTWWPDNPGEPYFEVVLFKNGGPSGQPLPKEERQRGPLGSVLGDTVDGRNPAPPGMYKTIQNPLKDRINYLSSGWLDLFHQQYNLPAQWTLDGKLYPPNDDSNCRCLANTHNDPLNILILLMVQKSQNNHLGCTMY